MSAEKILIIDDDRQLCELLAEYLGTEGFKVCAAHDGEQGLEMLIGRNFNLVVLDVMLPGGIEGFSVLRKIRAFSDIPVMMLTARGEDKDRIVGLESGADDYLPKPFNPRELVARIRAVLRRMKFPRSEAVADTDEGSCRIGDVRLDLAARMLICSGRKVELTAAEFSMLQILMRSAGQVVTRDHLAREVFGRNLSPYDRSIDVHVSKLRKKLGRGSDGTERIKGVRGSGYIYLRPLSATSGESDLNRL
jgi:DNA-binding response OmpR family regulator